MYDIIRIFINIILELTEEQNFDISPQSLTTRKEQIEKNIYTYGFKWIRFIFIIVLSVFLVVISNFEFIINYGFGLEILRRVLNFVLLISLGYLGITFLITSLFRKRLQKLELKIADLKVSQLREDIGENFFNKLVKINFTYIDKYYMQTQKQADKSFRLVCFSSVIGLIIIIIGIVMMFISKTEPAYVTTASGVISEFIAAIFFYLYNKTILKMSQYHQKLVLTQNVSLALKITEDIEGEEQNKAKIMLIERLTEEVNKFLSIKDL